MNLANRLPPSLRVLWRVLLVGLAKYTSGFASYTTYSSPYSKQLGLYTPGVVDDYGGNMILRIDQNNVVKISASPTWIAPADIPTYDYYNMTTLPQLVSAKALYTYRYGDTITFGFRAGVVNSSTDYMYYTAWISAKRIR